MAYGVFNLIIDFIGLIFFLTFVSEFLSKFDKDKGSIYWIGLIVSFILFWVVGEYKLGLVFLSLLLALFIGDVDDNDITIFKKIFNKIFKKMDDKYNPTINRALEFKKAIESNNQDVAENLLNYWDVNDANYLYATIIFEGMPPTDRTLSELDNWFNNAKNMKAQDDSLRQWYESTALEVLNLNKLE